MAINGKVDPFKALCEACRSGDTQKAMAMINQGANIHASDEHDYSPLVLDNKASLCGHYEVVQLLLESGAVCERDTFQGERCLYNALNERIRNLLLSYGYSYYERHPLQLYARHISSLLGRTHPPTADIEINSRIKAHKLILAARSPYFQTEFARAPEAKSLELPDDDLLRTTTTALRWLYLCELPIEKGESGAVQLTAKSLTAIDNISEQLEIPGLQQTVRGGRNRRFAQKQRTEEFIRCRAQMEEWFAKNLLRHKVVVDRRKVDDISWPRSNAIFADVLLRADEDAEDDAKDSEGDDSAPELSSIPIGPLRLRQQSSSRTERLVQSIVFPAHRAMLIRSEFFLAMYSSSFKEAQNTECLQVVPVGCTPEVLEAVLKYLYTDQVDFAPAIALDVLMAADQLLIEPLKVKAAVIVSTLARIESPVQSSSPVQNEARGEDEQFIVDDAGCFNIYDVIRVAWLCRVRRLEEFGARHLALHLEDYIDQDEFAQLIRDSASRIENRQETDSIEVLDDIRFYLSERFRRVFEDPGIGDLLDEDGAKCGRDEPTEDEYTAEPRNYRLLLGKIDQLLELLRLDA